MFQKPPKPTMKSVRSLVLVFRFTCCRLSTSQTRIEWSLETVARWRLTGSRLIDKTRPVCERMMVVQLRVDTSNIPRLPCKMKHVVKF